MSILDKKTKREIRVLSGFGHVSLAIWALIILFPLGFAFLAAFKSNTEIFIGNPFGLPSNWDFASFGRAWSEANIGTYFINSIIVVSASTFGTMLLGAMAAYVLARYDFFGNRAIYYYFVAGLAFPVYVVLTPLYLVVQNFGLLGTHTGLILVYIAYSLPFTIFFLAAFFKTLPNAVAEAAMIDGASHTKLFFRVMLPMAKPGLVSITIFNIIGQWNQYVLPVALLPGGDAQSKWLLTQGIASISTSAGYQADWAALFAALTIAIIPMIIVYALFQRQIQSGLTAGAVK
ncbi:sugar ABC transporter permease [Rhizocola hellebori]|uniref:Sugar ABC transporter permease n=1 Tax=Rhizocola hellebori TaxID=1392758 RepID=A0A8J3VJX9_9ACTN|nr:carbohydrate ABC transporter permease [Rhizocola hellebori]GIH09864.1 sugar ABC transporter permease [Rhizocola hellebori]